MSSGRTSRFAAMPNSTAFAPRSSVLPMTLLPFTPPPAKTIDIRRKWSRPCWALSAPVVRANSPRTTPSVAPQIARLPVGIDRLQQRVAIVQARRAVGMGQRGQTVLRRGHAERRVLRRQVAGAGHDLADGDEAGEDVGGLPAELRLEGHDG